MRSLAACWKVVVGQVGRHNRIASFILQATTYFSVLSAEVNISIYSHICEGVPFGGHSLTVLSVIVSSTFDAGSFEPFLGRFACDAFFHTAVVMFF